MSFKEPAHKQIGENIFHIHPFPAFKASRISGELVSLISPILVSVLPALSGGNESDEETSIFDMDISAAMPSIMKACSSLDGEKLENLMKMLITQYRNVAYETPDSNAVKWLTEDDANSIFLGEVEDMFVLAFEVIKLNFKGFFKNLGNLSGSQGKLLSQVMGSKNTDTSTAADSAI